MNPMLVIVLLAGGSVGLLAIGIGRIAGRRKALLQERMETYTGSQLPAAVPLASPEKMPVPSVSASLLDRVLFRRYLENVQESLARADIALRASEFMLLRFGLASGGFIIGKYVLGYIHSGLLLMLAGFIVPAIFVRIHQNRRREKFITQLADALMLQTSSLRAGYGFLKGMELVAKEMPDPISKELHRTLREINLGSTIEQALTNLGRRINSPDLDIVISAYLIQKELGGNLSEIMEHVAETIRERLRLRGDVKTLTAAGRFSGLLIGVLPSGLCLYFILQRPDYFAPMLGDPILNLTGGLHCPLGIALLVGALIWQIIGAYFIYRIVNVRI